MLRMVKSVKARRKRLFKIKKKRLVNQRNGIGSKQLERTNVREKNQVEHDMHSYVERGPT